MALPAIIAGVSALLSAFGKRKQAGAKEKQAQEAARLQRESAIRKWDQNEKGRVDYLQFLKGTGAARGGPRTGALVGGISPEMMQTRPYAGPDEPRETGHSTLGDILGGAGSIGSATASYLDEDKKRNDQAEREQQFLCAIVPSLPQCTNPAAPKPPAPSGGSYPMSDPGV